MNHIESCRNVTRLGTDHGRCQCWCHDGNDAPKRPPLKVTTTIVVEVDRDAYNAEYGSLESAEEIRQHVKGVVVTATESAFGNMTYATVKEWK